MKGAVRKVPKIKSEEKKQAFFSSCFFYSFVFHLKVASGCLLLSGYCGLKPQSQTLHGPYQVHVEKIGGTTECP